MNSSIRVSPAVMLLALIICLASTGYSQAPSQGPTRPQVERDVLPGRGFVPPPVILSHLTGKVSSTPVQLSALPTRFDWRESGMVTSVKNQGSCGSCYAFASLGNIEAKLLIDGEATYDFSENNAKECNWYEITGWGGGTSCSGGSNYQMANWFSKTGTVLETDDPYVSADVSCDGGNPYQKTLLDWRIICDETIADPAVIKQYIYDHGPVFTTMYTGGDGGDPAWQAEFSGYDGSYTLYYTGSTEPDHAVLIVGWDDDLVHAGPTNGGWIVKNSWGTSWGGTCGYGAESGYFTIAYGSASIGMWSSYMHDWQDYDSDGNLLYYDEGGFTSSWGYAAADGWGLCSFIQPATSYLAQVEFWTNDVTTDVDIYIYDDFNGSTVSNLLASKLNLSYTEAGYHSVMLDSPPEVTIGEDFYVVIKVTNVTYGYPVVGDYAGPSESNKTYLSEYGTPGSWFEMGDNNGVDVGIRVRTSVDLPVAVTDVEGPVPSGYSLSHAYPNPFNLNTTIAYSLERRGYVELSIYNLMGQRVKTLVSDIMPAGQHSVAWNGTDFAGKVVASGVYLYQLKTGEFVDSKKLVLLK
ncbi:MAG: T9SS type A sorting domain-containing protein [Candidatus Zixiibacteriota bacterium]|nr:MAG: T9SS type A sorting domain-containing protein [candidate division Zixibacteria bacterium]